MITQRVTCMGTPHTPGPMVTMWSGVAWAGKVRAVAEVRVLGWPAQCLGAP